jgi:hypothetical protein
MEGAVKKEATADQESGYTIATTAHAVDSGLVHMISKLYCRPAGFWP